MWRIHYSCIHKWALLCSNQLTSVTDHGIKLPTATLITSAYIAIWYICSFCYVFNANAPTIHTLIGSKSLWRIYFIKPKKFSISITAITFESSVHYGNILIAYSGIVYIPRNYQNVLTCHHYRLHIHR